MMEWINQLLDKLPPLRATKNPGLAALLGLLLGGIGLGLYFWSFVDFLVPLVIVVGLSLVFGQTNVAGIGWLGGAIIAGGWGYLRAQNSNARLHPASTAPGKP
jgi:hypothetical protein